MYPHNTHSLSHHHIIFEKLIFYSWRYSLVVGVEHILCAGSGTHEPLLEHTDISSLCGSSPGSQLKLMLAPSVVSEKGLKVTPATGEGSEQFTTVLIRN